MPTIPCNTDKILAQTLFLGASVSSFNVSKGWGGQSSQLTVNLVEDSTSDGCFFVPPNATTPVQDSSQFSAPTAPAPGNPHKAIVAADTVLGNTTDSKNFDANHYHTCAGDDCYVNPQGATYDSSTMRPEDRMVPGKVFYEYDPASSGVFSKYWYNGDPGFFGKPNKIAINNAYSPNNPPVNKGYDIIDTPVYFKMGDFSFGGIVQSWSESQGVSGKNYSVTVVGMESVLNNCYLILDKFAGAVYSKKSGAAPDHRFAGPRNYAGRDGVSYFDEISNGNIPNVFNIYGFLESLGRGGFGGAGANKEGISANKIIKALMVLTSNNSNSLKNVLTNTNGKIYADHGPKQAFSPYGRIVTKCMQEQLTYNPIVPTFNRFGVLAPSAPLLQENSSNTNKCQFVLDLSDIPPLPDDFRISGPVISIIDLINAVTEQTGYDYHINLYPNVISGSHVIKVHTINRLNQPATNEIGNAIKLLQAQGYSLSSVTYGKEKNETQAKHLLIGGSQQRLYQAKSLRLAYSQNNYIFNPRTNQFIDYMKMGNWSKTSSGVSTNLYHHGKIKLPTALSTRNVDLSNIINPSYSGVYKYDQDILLGITSVSGVFDTLDKTWNDKTILSSATLDTKFGNYGASAQIKQKKTDWGSDTSAVDNRFFPIHMDVICPFFGFVLDNEVNINTNADSNNDFRRIRPVWFDTWTGQLVVVIRTEELPVTDIGLESLALMSGVGYFLLTENEIRAALAGFDNFLVYCLSKTYKNDLIETLRRAYKIKYFNEAKRTNPGISDINANIEANRKSDWYWKLLGGNIAGAFNQTVSINPDKGDGSAELDPAVIKDLQILHNFVNEIGKFYGKKYMVLAPALKTYRDESFANIILSTQVGNAYVFGGGGDLYYNYTPTNDGAWEEYGNIIDDSLPVGGKEWYNLTDDMGKIKPILGYNNNEYFDYVRYNICKLTQAQTDNYRSLQKIDPFWSYSNYEYIMSIRDSSCNAGNFLLPSIDFSSLANTDYVNVEVKQMTTPPALANTFIARTATTPPTYTPDITTKAKDPWGSGLGTPLTKLYVTTSVEENIVFLNPENLSHPRILIDAPGLVLHSSSNQYAKDPNRTVISNVAVEDLSIYLHSVPDADWDYDWINFMLSYITPISSGGFMIGNFAGSANQSANFVEIAPKAVHPFFAGIPVKSNQYGYGPWTNYPILNYSGIFPPGKNIVLNDSLEATITNITVDESTAKRAINNWIGPTNVEVIEEFVPWNYGGMAFLDIVAHNEIEKKLNYQSVLESAQIDMPGLPLFGLGGAFTSGNLSSPDMTTTTRGITFRDVKDNDFVSTLFDLMPMASALYIPPSLVLSTQDLTYNYIALTGLTNYTVGPIITNIQTSMGQQGIQTTYSFRTYTKKIGLFNKENSDRIKKSSAINLKRNKQLANIQQQSINTLNTQSRFLQEKRLENANINGKDFSSKLFGWSPSTVFIAQSQPYIKYLETDPPYLEPTGLYSNSKKVDTRSISTANKTNILSTGLDVGSDSVVLNPSYLTDTLANVSLGNMLRHKTSVGMYELKEVNAQIENDYGIQSVMSLDGLFSPVSFYPTLKNSTFNYTLYSTSGVNGICPFCKGTKKIRTDFSFYKPAGAPSANTGIMIYCDRCSRLDELPTRKLQGAVTTSSTTQSIETLPPYIITSGTDISVLLEFNALSNSSSSISVASAPSSSSSSSSKTGVSIPINLINLNPIVVPYGDLKNQNVQAYSGVHPEGSGIHENLSIGIFTANAPRTFFDRSRHSIEIVGRGSVKPKNLSIHNSLGIYPSGLVRHQPDFYSQDLLLQKQIKDKENIDVVYQMNQRFVGLRGPLVMHGWGYDLAGYPVPNAADEPYEIDKFGQPRRFKIRMKEGYPKTVEYKTLKQGSLFEYAPKASPGVSTTRTEYIKTATLASQGIPGLLETSNVSEFIYEDDLSNGGGFPDGTETGANRTTGFQGSIISKTQMWTATGAIVTSYPSPGATRGKWNEKKKLKEFYLNWAERPDLWPVGPIDLRWDENRRVWTTKSSDAASLYKMVYVTLEQDLVKSEDTDETYPARGFLDDIEYSAEPLPNGFRRLVYLKDRGGYTAPRGAKLLCRYDKDSGYYEPVSKQSFVVGGMINSGSSATIEMSYVQGRKRGELVPTMAVSFDNPFSFNTISGNKGLFTFMNGKWTLTAAKEN